jgi:regulatory protein
VVERLTHSGLLDDSEFAAYWLHNRKQFSPRSDRALRSELRQKGIDPEVIDAALNDLPGEEARALAAGRKRLRNVARLDESEFRHRMMGYLGRRGFSYATARTATDALWQETQTCDVSASHSE